MIIILKLKLRSKLIMEMNFIKDLSKSVSVTYRRTQMFYTEKLKELGISSGQYMFIVCICENIGQTQDELSQRLIIDKSTVAKIVSQLETKGFITKNVNPKDRRAFSIFPTDKAVAIYPEILKIKNEWHNKMTENFSDIERDVFEKLMVKVMENSINNCQ
ncbi:transcriptional regulator [Desulfosporosinus orientis DSM 765]|uniref:Transcriptional regulator n=1 Tax=Desulfosporosinus orientis (strain ATCC 19365 / DSM 765 / NCIMB 8382 / VKM B-1628 / Singapore I) TaxID=768706 RepID=G7WBS6_DESOD|nr:MarR family transcriptional regulator [Desulfosporosinus orientis]AET69323.1 transcriptional regulator [Desulfosporosinus orientis DSM 765]